MALYIFARRVTACPSVELIATRGFTKNAQTKKSTKVATQKKATDDKKAEAQEAAYMDKTWVPFVNDFQKRHKKVNRSLKMSPEALEEDRQLHLKFDRLEMEERNKQVREEERIARVKKAAIEAIPEELLEKALLANTEPHPAEIMRQMPTHWPVYKDDDLSLWWAEYNEHMSKKQKR